MLHGPTELLWIGCFTRLIWTPRSKSVTLTPNINSQTFWPKEISHAMSGTFCFICDISTCCTKNFCLISCSATAKRIQEQKEEERVVSKSRFAAMNLSSSKATSSSSAASPIASKSLVMPIASGKPDSRMRINPNSSRRSVDFSSATKGCILRQVRSKIILGIATQCEEQRWNPKQHCWLQNTWYTNLNGENAGCTATK